MELITIDVDPKVKQRIEELAKDINKYVTDGKWEVFNKDAQYFMNKYEMNELFLLGVKQVNSYNGIYLELPYDGLEEKDVNAALLRYKMLIGDNA